MTPEKWSIFFPTTGGYIGQTRGGNGPGWTSNRAEAEQYADASCGVVVDTADFCANWPMYLFWAAVSGDFPIKKLRERCAAEHFPLLLKSLGLAQRSKAA